MRSISIKTLIYLLSVFSYSISNAGISRLKRNFTETISVEKKELIAPKATKNTSNKKSVKHLPTKTNAVESEIAKINAETEKKNLNAVENFLNSKNLGITDNTNSFDILTGSIVKATLLNSVVSSNIDGPIILEVSESRFEIPKHARVICQGSSRGKRVHAVCSKLIVQNEEYDIFASILNSDGTAGIPGHVYTGKEEGIVGAIFGGALTASLDVSRDRIPTTTGEMAVNSHRNKILTGAMGGVEEAVEVLESETKGKEFKITIESGKEVLVFFNQRFKQ